MRMSIRLDDGRHINGSGEDIDTTQVNLTWAGAVRKFLRTALTVLGQSRAERLVDTVGRLEGLSQAGVVAHLIRRE